MSKHLTIRMAWHDNNWDGKVCCNPEANTYCTGVHSLLSGRIEKKKKTDVEQKLKGQYIQGNFDPENVPPCYWSINAFGDKPFDVKHSHAFRWVKHTIAETVHPYSIFTWPFKLSFVHTEESKAIHGNYWPDLEQRIRDFTGKFKKDQSIMFFYANYDNPVSADDMKYLLLGCSVVDKVQMPEHFPFTKKELDRMGKGEAGSSMKNFPTLNWAIQFTHQPDKAVLLPYREYVKHVEDYPEEFEKLNDIKVVIDEPSLVRSFKYVAMDIDDDKCLYLLYKLRKSIFKIREHNRQVIPHDLEEEEKRLDALIEMVWKRRGIYPSLEKVLRYFLKRDCAELADAIKGITNKKYDLLQCFEDIAGNDIPDALEDFEDELDESLWNERYRTAVRPINESTGMASDFTREILLKANRELDSYRNKYLHADAGGLVLVEDKEAAEFVGEMLTKITGEEAVIVQGKRIPLSTHQYIDTIYPEGFRYLREFRLDPFPVFVYDIEGLLLEKTIFMCYGENTTCILYRIRRLPKGIRQGQVLLEVRPLLAMRSHHDLVREILRIPFPEE